MKILVFENQLQEVKESFKDANDLDFNDSLEIEYVTRSQDFKRFEDLNEIDLIFVDIDLSTKSDKDGYGLIDDLVENYKYNNICVLSGHPVEGNLIKRGYEKLDIVKKPIFSDQLEKVIKKFYK